MSVLSHQSIKKANILTPFHEKTIDEVTNLSYGCGAASYDISLAEDIDLYEGLVTLASAIEYFTMPGNVCGVVHDKSSLARAGILIQNTFIDPGWRGYLTLEISYHQITTSHRITKNLELVKGTPIAQIVFHYLDEHTNQPYSGQYQDQQPGAQPSNLQIPKQAVPHSLTTQEAKSPKELNELERFGRVWLGRK